MKLAKRLLRKAFTHVASLYERPLLAQGKQLSHWARNLPTYNQLEDTEFSVFSQFGDDGIIQYLVGHIEINTRTFVEFGVEDFSESNTRFLMMNNNWSGFVLDGSDDNIERVHQAYYFWRHDLTAKAAFITTENVNGLLAQRPFENVGILHIDIDGNDYWVWKAIDSFRAEVIIVEYNSVFGMQRAITMPYVPDFDRLKAHHSFLYGGASLAALVLLGAQKGYAFVGSNSAGNNAYFVRTDLLNASVREVSVEEGYRESKFRESRDERGRLTHIRGEERLRTIAGMPVLNVRTGERELV